MDSAQGIEQRADYLTSRMLMITLAATHTTTTVVYRNKLLIIDVFPCSV